MPGDAFPLHTAEEREIAAGAPKVADGQVWRSPNTWWRVRHVDAGKVLIEGPRGSARTSRDGGATWSDPATIMTLAGFHAWIRKSGAICNAE